MTKHKPPPTPLPPPDGYHRHAIELIVGNYHVSKSDADVVADWQRRMRIAGRKGNHIPDDATIRPWCDAALTVHHKNQANYDKIMRGDFT